MGYTICMVKHSWMTPEERLRVQAALEELRQVIRGIYDGTIPIPAYTARLAWITRRLPKRIQGVFKEWAYELEHEIRRARVRAPNNSITNNHKE